MCVRAGFFVLVFVVFLFFVTLLCIFSLFSSFFLFNFFQCLYFTSICFFYHLHHLSDSLIYYLHLPHLSSPSLIRLPHLLSPSPSFITIPHSRFLLGGSGRQNRSGRFRRGVQGSLLCCKHAPPHKGVNSANLPQIRFLIEACRADHIRLHTGT